MSKKFVPKRKKCPKKVRKKGDKRQKAMIFWVVKNSELLEFDEKKGFVPKTTPFCPKKFKKRGHKKPSRIKGLSDVVPKIPKNSALLLEKVELLLL